MIVLVLQLESDNQIELKKGTGKVSEVNSKVQLRHTYQEKLELVTQDGQHMEKLQM